MASAIESLGNTLRPDVWRFLKGWLDQPLTVGAISPSGPHLAAKMAGYVPRHGSAKVVELGPGTGPVTHALLAHGVAPSDLTAIEYSADFAAHLRAQFKGVNIVQGDAYTLRETLSGHVDAPLAAVVSSLPLLTRPAGARRALLQEAFSLLAPGGAFIQFSYGLAPPIKPEPGVFTLEISSWIVRNVPPARVFVYRSV